MRTTVLLAAALAAGVAIPALANDGRGYEPNQAATYFQANAQAQRQAVSRDGERIVTELNKARNAVSQGFFPVDTTQPSANR